MFNILKRPYHLISPFDGITYDLADVPDEVFSKRLAGDGIAILPKSNIVRAPCDGLLSLVFKTNHAFGITTDKNIDIIVHIGLDTVELKGEGFEALVEEGTFVKAGTPIIKYNKEFIESKKMSLLSPVLITNLDSISKIKVYTNIKVEAGKTDILKYYL